MSAEGLKIINQLLKSAGISYAFHEWNKAPKYPYQIGEYQEVETLTEDGYKETTFYLDGFARGAEAYIQLEADKEKIYNVLGKDLGYRAITESGNSIAIFYAFSNGQVPTQDAELKRMEVALRIKEWRS